MNKFYSSLPEHNLDWIIYAESMRSDFKDHGLKVSDTRFPFTYHHDFSRGNQINALSRADVAHRMGNFEKIHGNRAYWVANMLGAMFYLASSEPTEFTLMLAKNDNARDFIKFGMEALDKIGVNTQTILDGYSDIQLSTMSQKNITKEQNNVKQNV